MKPLLRMEDVKKYYSFTKGIIKRNKIDIKAVDGVNLQVYKGETLGLVGESGSGKTTIARLILNFIKPTENTIYFDDIDIYNTSKAEQRKIRRRMGVVFQDPAASLNPRATIMNSLQRPLTVNGIAKEDSIKTIEETLKKVNLGKELLKRYPHQLSGGQQQRVSIARAILLNPELLVLDEPTSALDISVQAQILNLLLQIQEEYNLTYIFISHNLSVVKYISDRIGVMYLGKLVEIGSVEEIYNNPKHPYTIGLLSSEPIRSPRERNKKQLILSGEPGSLMNPPKGCRFAPRCPYKIEICEESSPIIEEIKEYHSVACYRWKELDFTEFAKGVEA
jgi:oligopeptide/dipeptide ABC transporter ATP-binding protein